MLGGKETYVGAWGVGPFDNDDAADWVYELQESEGTAAIVAALRAVGPDGYLEAPECSIALAAAEVVAALRGQPLAMLPPEVAGWVRENPSTVTEEVLGLALMAIHRIETASELKELWDESSESEAWSATLMDLKRRLGPE
jgi:hypothetical protein